jgi:hypothetical protein
MVRLKHLVMTAGLALLAVSCGGGSETATPPSGVLQTPGAPVASGSPAPVAQSPASPTASSPGVSPSPGASPSPGVSPILQAGSAPPPQVALIRPTDPAVRLREMRVGRSDPFASVAPPPPPDDSPAPRGNSGGGGFSGSNRPSLPPLPNRNIDPPSPRGYQPQPPSAGIPPVPAPLPTLPQPTQARGVKVLGIAMVRGVPQAIISAPDEKTTRTVAVGDRLSNGLVVVKAIDMGRPDPVVVLEQFGQVVEVSVGQPTIAQVPGKK